MSESTTIQVSRQVKSQLDEVKDRNGHTTYDSVIRSLLAIPCKGTECAWYWNCVKYGCPKFLKRGVEP